MYVVFVLCVRMLFCAHGETHICFGFLDSVFLEFLLTTCPHTHTHTLDEEIGTRGGALYCKFVCFCGCEIMCVSSFLMITCVLHLFCFLSTCGVCCCCVF